MNAEVLICRGLQGTASDAEAAQLRAWREASDENERHYREIVSLLGTVKAARLGEALDPPPLLEDILAPSAGRRFGPSSRARSSFVWKAGGAVAAAALVLLLLQPRFGSPDATPEGFGTGEIVTGRSESTTIRLDDGTIIRLGPESRLRLTGGTERREAWLDGRAFFAVSKVEGSPFRIRTHAGDAVVLGTRFDLKATNDDLRVLVVEGAVKLNAVAGEVEVTANEVGTVGPAVPPRNERIDAAALAGELGWLGNFIVFEATPLGQAARELATHYDVPVEVLDSTLAAETIQGVFNDESLEEVIRVICRTTSAHCSVGKTGVKIGL